MAYCSACRQAMQEGAKFCSACGTPSQDPRGGAVPPAVQVTSVVVVEPKRGGRLGLKGFLTGFILYLVFNAATLHTNAGTRATGAIIAFGIGAAYIISNLRKWRRDKETVRGAEVGWGVAVLMILLCIGSLMSLTEHGDGTGGSSSSSNSSSTPTDPKEILLKNVRLDFKWRKEGFGNVMVADFTVTNPTEHRFKDFEIKCTHSAPSGTEIDSNTQTIYKIVEPNSTKVITGMNMGFIHSQATSSRCQITDLSVVH